jgi:hypothetical protein
MMQDSQSEANNNPYLYNHTINNKQDYNQKQYSELRKEGYLHNTTSEAGRQSYRQTNTSRSGSKFESGASSHNNNIEFYRS